MGKRLFRIRGDYYLSPRLLVEGRMDISLYFLILRYRHMFLLADFVLFLTKSLLDGGEDCALHTVQCTVHVVIMYIMN
jgi:hypothetical protein